MPDKKKFPAMVGKNPSKPPKANMEPRGKADFRPLSTAQRKIKPKAQGRKR